MPNWVENNLVLTGDNTYLVDFNKHNIDIEGNLDFNIKVPLPSDKEDDWYNWRIQNWGTKWIASNTSIDFNIKNSDDKQPRSLLYSFTTAWSPPTEWIYTVSKMYPEITFNLNYGEYNCDFSGDYVVENGNITKNTYGNYAEYFKPNSEE